MCFQTAWQLIDIFVGNYKVDLAGYLTVHLLQYLPACCNSLQLSIPADRMPGGEPEHSAAYKANIRSPHISMFYDSAGLLAHLPTFEFF